MINVLLDWCGRANPQTENEKLMTRFGAELLVEICLRILGLLGLGLVLGRGKETVIFLAVFCSLRSQAGGVHAKTGWGCGLCMIGMWCAALLGIRLQTFSYIVLDGIAVAAIVLVILAAPQTVNRDCYTAEMIIRKKLNAAILIGLFFVIGVFCYHMRNLIMCSVALEAVTLLPGIKAIRKEQKLEKGNC